MPEGNEIHRWAERHFSAFGGRPVRVDGPQGRFTDSAVIDGRKLQRVMAVGKHLGEGPDSACAFGIAGRLY
jgi:endonuclease VIII